MRNDRSNWTEEDGMRSIMCLAYEETHKRRIRDDEEEAAWKRLYKARVREAN